MPKSLTRKKFSDLISGQSYSSKKRKLSTSKKDSLSSPSTSGLVFDNLNIDKGKDREVPVDLTITTSEQETADKKLEILHKQNKEILNKIGKIVSSINSLGAQLAKVEDAIDEIKDDLMSSTKLKVDRGFVNVIKVF